METKPYVLTRHARTARPVVVDAPSYDEDVQAPPARRLYDHLSAFRFRAPYAHRAVAVAEAVRRCES